MRQVFFAIAVLSYVPLGAAAQDELANAEQAFLDLEYEAARTAAQAALEAGGNELADTARLYDLLGTAAAFVEEESVAYEAYRRWLALRPDAEVSQSVPPSLRTPFLRARGWWAAQRGGLGVTLAVVDRGADRPLRFVVRIADPLDMVAQARLHMRAVGGVEFTTAETASSEEAIVDATQLGLGDTSAAHFDYHVELLDAQGNIVATAGSQVQPERLENPRSGIAVASNTSTSSAGGTQVWEEWWLWTIIGVAIAAGVGIGVYFAVPPELNGRVGIAF